MTTKQRAYLKSLAMTMDPIFQVGKSSMTPGLTEAISEALEARDILGGYPLDGRRILWCCTELNTKEEMDRAVRIVKEVQEGC